jgi:hypothetical protein
MPAPALVDATVIEQLRVGHAEWGRRQQQQIAGSVVVNSEEKAPVEWEGHTS